MNKAIQRVKLISMTKNPIQTIYLSARQCYKEGWVGDLEILEDGSIYDKDNDTIITISEQEKLIKQVLSNGHNSICEHVSFTFAVDGVSRAESHQHVRHRIATYSQQSQRFCDSGNFNIIMPPNIERDEHMSKKYMDIMDSLAGSYIELQNFLKQNDKTAISANEDARFVLPNACETKLNFTMNCNSLLHFFSERCCTRAQWEIRNVANMCLNICKEELPVVFNNAGPKCFRTGMCFERKSCGVRPHRDEVMKVYNEFK